MKYTETVILDRKFNELVRFDLAHSLMEYFEPFQKEHYYFFKLRRMIECWKLCLDDIYIKVRLKGKEENQAGDSHRDE